MIGMSLIRGSSSKGVREAKLVQDFNEWMESWRLQWTATLFPGGDFDVSMDIHKIDNASDDERMNEVTGT